MPPAGGGCARALWDAGGESEVVPRLWSLRAEEEAEAQAAPGLRCERLRRLLLLLLSRMDWHTVWPLYSRCWLLLPFQCALE